LTKLFSEQKRVGYDMQISSTDKIFGIFIKFGQVSVPILKVVHQSERIKTIIEKTSAYAASFETKRAFFG
jgi:hypothetical protein